MSGFTLEGEEAGWNRACCRKTEWPQAYVGTFVPGRIGRLGIFFEEESTHDSDRGTHFGY